MSRLQCDLDEPCDPRVQCTNLRPGYKCGQCPPGYTSVGPTQGIGADGTRRTDEGRHQCMDIDECADGRNGGCAQNSQCINTEVRYIFRLFITAASLDLITQKLKHIIYLFLHTLNPFYTIYCKAWILIIYIKFKNRL